MARVQCQAKHEFHAENDAELSFRIGDIITIINQDDPGWWEGELNGQRGLFPYNYVEVIQRPAAAAPPRGPAPPSGKAPAKSIPIMQTSAPAASKPTGAPPAGMVKAGPQPPKGAAPPADAGPVKTGVATNVGIKVSAEAKEGKGSGSKDNVRKGKSSKTKFGIWSSNMAKITATCMIVMGVLGLVWYAKYQSATAFDLYAGIYNLVIGIGILVFETKIGDERSPSLVWGFLRGFVYVGLGVLPVLSLPGLITGIFLFIVGITNFVALFLREAYDKPPHVLAKKEAKKLEESTGALDALVQTAIMLKEQNKVGVIVFMALYVLANFVIFVMVLLDWTQRNNSLADAARLSGYGPFAKAFGNLLDFNCSLVLVPVCRSFIRILYNRSTADQGCIARSLRFILQFVPLDRNIAFHKLVARVIVFAVFGHVIMHFINYSLRPTQTLNLFGIWPWYSGGIICFAMLMIYSAAFDNTKRGQFEIFWYNHHFFLIFFGFILTHAKLGFQLNFWKWFIGPGVLYLLERCMRIYRAYQPVVVLSVTIMPPVVFSLEFAKEGVFSEPYKQGQYMFIQAPFVSRIQWHPFTISSAPEEKSVTLHIRVCDKGSWTEQLQAMFQAMAPRGQSYIRLDRMGPSGKIPGKILGPDGRQMIRIDGPHSAPTQHVSEYSVAMIVGAGIGVTPVAATLKSIVFHRWKFFIGQCFPDHAYFMWVCGWPDVDAFRWLIRAMKDAQDEIVHMTANNPENMKTKTFEFHVWVTSVPKDAKDKPIDLDVKDEIGFWGLPREDAKVEKMRANFTEEDIYRVMKNPHKHTQLGDIHIYNGRPEWEPRFEAVAKRHPKGDIGVTFCGNPFIAKDLAKNCHIASHGRTDGIFVLHKENF